MPTHTCAFSKSVSVGSSREAVPWLSGAASVAVTASPNRTDLERGPLLALLLLTSASLALAGRGMSAELKPLCRLAEWSGCETPSRCCSSATGTVRCWERDWGAKTDAGGSREVSRSPLLMLQARCDSVPLLYIGQGA